METFVDRVCDSLLEEMATLLRKECKIPAFRRGVNDICALLGFCEL